MARLRRLPAKVKKERGTFDKRHGLENEFEPILVQNISVPHEYEKSKVLTDLFLKVTGELKHAGILATLDLEMICAYCESMEMYYAAKNDIKKHGRKIEDEKGKLYLNPDLDVMFKALDRAVKIAQLIGITPQARTRISMPPRERPKESDSLFEEIK